MTNNQLNRQRLEKIKSWRETYGAGSNVMLPAEEAEELARIALAAMNSEPVAYTDERNLGYIDRGRETAYLWGKQNSETGDVPLYRHAQPAPVVPEEKSIPNTLSMYAVDAVAAIAEVKGWNACRAAMLQASPVCTCPSGDGSLRWPCPVHAGNSPVIPDSARDALEKALAAMEFMGDTLNNLDAVCTEDVELVAPAFDAVRSVLAAALQEGK
ncbi:TPA: hypothetical protein ACQ83P_004220 [Klebsiella pneumoniae]|uniref:hypothetical protein n=1 Tax=Klebsiella pneumoniae TaxID=573 RepID=UPI003989029B